VYKKTTFLDQKWDYCLKYHLIIEQTKN
jgi:hypothetical protein